MMSTPRPADRFVLDGSVTLAWLFLDEADPYADAIVAKLPALVMLVPHLWHLEIANVLLLGERRGRCSQADTVSWLSYLSGLPIVLDAATESRAWGDTFNLARQQGLSAYEAAYLELAMREGIPLATLDAKLTVAMQALGVALYTP
jgi:predicted nucleic acid-binding protein